MPKKTTPIELRIPYAKVMGLTTNAALSQFFVDEVRRAGVPIVVGTEQAGNIRLFEFFAGVEYGSIFCRTDPKTFERVVTWYPEGDPEGKIV